MNGRKLINYLGRRFPKSIAKKYGDYVGLMVGKIPSEVNKVLLCLDYDDEVHEYALKFRPDLILTHHPFIFGTKKEVFEKYPIKKALYEKLEKEGFCIYSMHTNFDEGKGGMNDALANALHLEDIYAPDNNPMMRIGYLANEMDINDFARYAKECLKVNYGLLLPYGKQVIKKVGVIGGGGAEDYIHAKEEDCDLYISGDMRHRTRRDIILNHYSYLDLPHEIEKIFIPTMKNILVEFDSSLDILCVDHEKEALVI